MGKIIVVDDNGLSGAIEWELPEMATNALAKLTPETERVTAIALGELMSVFAGNLILCVTQDNLVFQHLY